MAAVCPAPGDGATGKFFWEEDTEEPAVPSESVETEFANLLLRAWECIGAGRTIPKGVAVQLVYILRATGNEALLANADLPSLADLFENEGQCPRRLERRRKSELRRRRTVLSRLLHSDIPVSQGWSEELIQQAHAELRTLRLREFRAVPTRAAKLEGDGAGAAAAADEGEGSAAAAAAPAAVTAADTADASAPSPSPAADEGLAEPAARALGGEEADDGWEQRAAAAGGDAGGGSSAAAVSGPAGASVAAGNNTAGGSGPAAAAGGSAAVSAEAPPAPGQSASAAAGGAATSAAPPSDAPPCWVATAPLLLQRKKGETLLAGNVRPLPPAEPGVALVKFQYRRVLRTVRRHAKDQASMFRARRANAESCARDAVKLAEALLTRQELIREREARERLRLLRENDISGYMELIRKSKNQKIQELLRRTSEFLAEIASKVPAQQTAARASGTAREAKKRRGRAGSRDDNGGSGEPGEGGGGVGEPRAGDDEDASGGALPDLSHLLAPPEIGSRASCMEQPASLVGGNLLPYQLSGLRFLANLYRHNLSGILADEMGLGKTVQTIAFLAYLREVHREGGIGASHTGSAADEPIFSPSLVIVPLSTLPNWVNEFERWCPAVRVLVFRGRNARSDFQARMQRFGSGPGRVNAYHFDVVLTTYEWTLRERRLLGGVPWDAIVVDEGHRMKNSQSKFHLMMSSEFRSKLRLILTGTPLQNDLRELWGLLHFVLPRIFDSGEDFERWFQQPLRAAPRAGAGLLVDDRDASLDEEEEFLIIDRLHAVLRPFLLRRVKEDVLRELPQKQEFVIRLPLTAWQRAIYEQLTRRFAEVSRGREARHSDATLEERQEGGRRSARVSAAATRGGRGGVRVADGRGGGGITPTSRRSLSSTRGAPPAPALSSRAKRELDGLGVGFFPAAPAAAGGGPGASLNNLMMQLRKVANHPYLFESEFELDETLFRASSKFEALDRMLPKLLAFGHKTLIFCQMTQLMDLLDAYLEFRQIPRFRLDGSVSVEERQAQMAEFNAAANRDTLLFVLSTRAGGLGLNLQAADTVIIFDSDWNPHQDRQAEARAHRIGQTAEVRVFRLVTTCAVEQAVLAKAEAKLAVDARVIQAGKFNNKTSEAERQEELRRLLVGEGGDGLAAGRGPRAGRGGIPVTTPAELNRFMARSPAEENSFQDFDREKVFASAPLARFHRGRADLRELLAESRRYVGEAEVPERWKEGHAKPRVAGALAEGGSAGHALDRRARRARPSSFRHFVDDDDDESKFSDSSPGPAEDSKEKSAANKENAALHFQKSEARGARSDRRATQRGAEGSAAKEGTADAAGGGEPKSSAAAGHADAAASAAGSTLDSSRSTSPRFAQPAQQGRGLESEKYKGVRKNRYKNSKKQAIDEVENAALDESGILQTAARRANRQKDDRAGTVGSRDTGGSKSESGSDTPSREGSSGDEDPGAGSSSDEALSSAAARTPRNGAGAPAARRVPAATGAGRSKRPRRAIPPAPPAPPARGVGGRFAPRRPPAAPHSSAVETPWWSPTSSSASSESAATPARTKRRRRR